MLPTIAPAAASRICRPSAECSQHPWPPTIVGGSSVSRCAGGGTNWYRASFTRSVSHLRIGHVVAEHDGQPRTGERHFGDGMLPVVLATAAHHEQIAVAEMPRSGS